MPRFLFLLLCCLLLSARAQDNALGGDLVFDVRFYMQRNPDVARFYAGNATRAYEHWMGDGMREGRESSPVFNVKFYAEKYPDVAAIVKKQGYKGAVEHWLQVGLPEGRQGTETFDVKVYLETIRGRVQDVTFEKAVHHYMALPPPKRTAYIKAPAAAPTALAPPGKDPVVKGKFYMEVDDVGILYVNGVKLHRGTIGLSQSPEVELKAGDRLVVQLHNVAAPRYFKLLFVSSDKTQMINFPNTVLKVLPDAEATDFDAAQVAGSAHYAREIKSARNPFPFKNQSEFMWGEADLCALGGVLTREMFVPLKLQ